MARTALTWLGASLLLLALSPALADNLRAGVLRPSQDAKTVRVDVAAVNESIEQAKAFLYSKQSSDGTWEFVPDPREADSESSRSRAAQSERVGQWGGRTALATYALLAAGEHPKEDKLVRAVEFIKTAELTGTYAIGIRLMALSYLPMDEQIRRTVERDGELLLRTVKTEGPAAGHYDYNSLVRDDGKSYSHSRSQYGVLGMWAAAKMGYKVDPRYWQLVDEGWRRNQLAGGGWNYNDYSPGEQYQREQPGMTAAGVASLMITNEFLLGEKAGATTGNLIDEDIEQGLAWLAQNFELMDPDREFRASWTYITLYNLERLSVTGGLRYIGEHDWYARGADWLLNKQRSDGSWKRPGGGGGEQVEVVDTAFALLFLSRGRSPLLAAKLAHTSVDSRGRGRERRPDWNQRPRDLANLADYTGEGVERELHWQVLDSQRSVEEWLDAPVLYISGSTALNFDEEVKDKLKRYTELGGLVVFNSDGGKQPFSASVLKLARELYPQYEFRVLTPEHRIYNMQYPLSRGAPRIQSLGNGARELMILVSNADLGRAWQLAKSEPALQLGANIYLYSVDRTHMRYKGERHLIDADRSARPNRRAVVGRLRYEGNWDPEPAGWGRLSAVLHNHYDVELETRPLEPASDELEGVDVLHLTGTDEFELSEEARGAIGKFLEDGGTLLVDAAGGSSAFSAAADRELRALFTDAGQQLESPLPADHDLFAERDGIPPLRVRYRLDAMEELGVSGEPRLRGIERDGRLAVVYSPQDLSVGLVGVHVAGVIGYEPETATAIVARVIRQAAREE